jgi:hypothetical protein
MELYDRSFSPMTRNVCFLTGTKVDRIACPWLIRRFVDPNDAFLFVAPAEVTAVTEPQQARADKRAVNGRNP